MSAAALYIDLLKNCLTRYIFMDEQPRPEGYSVEKMTELRSQGKDWPIFGESMIGILRMDNLQYCVEHVLKHNIPGDLIETGVWRGGACIFMRGILQAYGDTTRNVWVADSFKGVPPPDPKYKQDDGNILHTAYPLAIDQWQVIENFKKYKLLDDRVKFLVGLFKDTLHQAPIEKLAVLRLDGDLYGSTWEALEALYPKLSPGGFVIVDDYALVSCKEAIEDFRRQHQISEPLERIDAMSVFWQKSPEGLEVVPATDKIFQYGGFKFLDFSRASSPDWIARDVIDKDVYGIKKIDFRPGDVVIDIGANIGIFSIYLAKLHPQIRVIAFEPSAANYGHLLKNININGAHNVEPYYLALTDDGRKVQISLNEGNTGGASIYGPEKRAADHSNWCDSVRLDDFLSDCKIDRVKLIKCDVEGAEYEIFRALKLVPECASIEIHTPRGHNDLSDSPESLRDLLKSKIPDERLAITFA